MHYKNQMCCFIWASYMVILSHAANKPHIIMIVADDLVCYFLNLFRYLLLLHKSLFIEIFKMI